MTGGLDMFITISFSKKKNIAGTLRNSQKIVCLGISRKRVVSQRRNLNDLVLSLRMPTTCVNFKYYPIFIKVCLIFHDGQLYQRVVPPPEKVSKFLGYVFGRVMQESRSYIKYSSDLIKKIKEIKQVPRDVIMVKADVVGLYPSNVRYMIRTFNTSRCYGDSIENFT